MLTMPYRNTTETVVSEILEAWFGALTRPARTWPSLYSSAIEDARLFSRFR